MQDQKRFGENVRALRMAKGGLRTCSRTGWGYTATDVGAIERGERNVTLRTMRTIADTLGVKVVELVKGL
jgi:transcriptional regulator with XRE-family HTH domain